VEGAGLAHKPAKSRGTGSRVQSAAGASRRERRQYGAEGARASRGRGAPLPAYHAGGTGREGRTVEQVRVLSGGQPVELKDVEEVKVLRAG
jgi:hypothetical protein